MRRFPALSSDYKDPHAYPPGVAFNDGQYVDIAEAKFSVLDYGFLHSDATYDTVHVWDGALLRLDLHLDRFFGGMERLRMTIPHGRAAVTDILMNCVALSGHRTAYVEMIGTRGTGPTFSRDPRDCSDRFMAFAVPFGSVANPDQMARGLHVAVSETVRIPAASVDPAIKNYHWLDLIRGLYDAYDKGADTALGLDGSGNIAKGAGFNVFAVKNGALTTPATGVLPGITRRTVFDLCAQEGLSCIAAPLTRVALTTADEVLVASTAGGIMPVASVDRQPIGSGGRGPVTLRLKDRYWAMHRKPEWSTPVEYPM